MPRSLGLVRNPLSVLYGLKKKMLLCTFQSRMSIYFFLSLSCHESEDNKDYVRLRVRVLGLGLGLGQVE